MALLQILRAVPGDPDFASGVFGDEDLEWQIDGDAGGDEHDWRSGFGAAENQELGVGHAHANFLSFAAVIDEGEEGDGFCGQVVLQLLIQFRPPCGGSGILMIPFSLTALLMNRSFDFFDSGMLGLRNQRHARDAYQGYPGLLSGRVKGGVHPLSVRWALSA